MEVLIKEQLSTREVPEALPFDTRVCILRSMTYCCRSGQGLVISPKQLKNSEKKKGGNNNIGSYCSITLHFNYAK